MSDFAEHYEQETLLCFLHSSWSRSDIALEIENVEIRPYPNGRNAPPDFCLCAGERRIGVEILRAYPENRERTLRTRQFAEAQEMKNLIARLRQICPECRGWIVFISLLPDKKILKRFRKVLEDEFNKVCRETRGIDIWPDHPLLRAHRVHFYHQESSDPVYICWGSLVDIDLAPIVDNVVRHMKTFNIFAQKYTDLIFLLDDVAGLLKGETQRFAGFLEDVIRHASKPEIARSLELLRGIYVVHWPASLSTVPDPPAVERLWPIGKPLGLGNSHPLFES